MRVGSPEERAALTGITPEVLDRLRRMQASGASLDDLIVFLRISAVPRPAASIALAQAGAVKGLGKAREAVEHCSAYDDWPEPYRGQADARRATGRDAIASAA